MSGGVVSGREALAEALAEHEADVTSYDAADIHGCRCGWELTTEQKRSENYGWDDFRGHLADALLASGAVREEAAVLREGAQGALQEAADLLAPYSGIGMSNGATRAEVSAWLRDRAATLAPQDPA